MQKRKNIKQSKKVKRVTLLSVSVSEKVGQYLKTLPKGKVSAYLNSLVEKDLKEQATPLNLQPEEAEIREALKARKKLVESYGSKVQDFEENILKGIMDWDAQEFDSDSGEALRDYLKLYEKHFSSQDGALLWVKVDGEVAQARHAAEETRRKHYYEEELVIGDMTRRQVLDKIREEAHQTYR